MKYFIRLVAVVMVVALLLAMPTFAAEEATPWASRYIMSTCVYLNPTSSTQFDVWYEVIALGIMDEVGAYSIRIQESTDGQNWTTVKTCTPATHPSMVIEDSAAHTGRIIYNGGISGRYYRARIILFAANSSGEGHVSTTTEIIRL